MLRKPRTFTEVQKVHINRGRVEKRHQNSIDNKLLQAKQKLARKVTRDNLYITNPEQYEK